MATELSLHHPGKRHCLAALSVLYILYALLFAPAGFLTTDEFLYAAMTERLVEAGSLFFKTGYEETPSETLRLLFLTPTAHGLTPQYPAGYAFLAAPFFMVGGIRSMILLNTFAVIALVFVTERLAKVLLDDDRLALNAALILMLASFIADYAFAILPHGVAALAMTLAVYFAALSWRSATGARVNAALAGIFIGLGIHVRVDVIIIVPLLAAWLLGSGRAPLGRIAALLLGLAPGLMLSSWLNYLKFGTLKPLTYGADTGTGAANLTSLAAYHELLPLLAVALLVAVSFAFERVRTLFLGWRGALALAAGVGLAVAMPATGGLVLRALRGLYVLLFDLQSYDFVARYSGRSAVHEGGWILFAGGVKKALFESLPYAGFFALPLVRLFQRGDRAPYVLLVLLPLAWFTFFAVNQWHGGQSSNLRYFTPMLPLLAILAAAAWAQLIALEPGPRPWGNRQKLLSALLLAVLIALAWRSTHGVAVLFLVGLGKGLFVCALAAALMVLISPSVRRLAPLARGVFGLTLMAAFFGAYFHDLAISTIKRGWDIEGRQDCARIEPDALVISHLPRRYYCHFMRAQGRTAIYLVGQDKFDADLVDWHHARKRPVYTDAQTVAFLKEDGRARGYEIMPASGSGGDLYRILPHTGAKP
ncbi:MAG: hypothetical protein R3229_08265 [Alphaproteobacteria bacterium]|nr:hypothetical protein [Alphaproteobacteria bacterium]